MKNKSNTKQMASSSKELQATLASINERLDSMEEVLRLILVNMVITEADECIERCGANSHDIATVPINAADESANGATSISNTVPSEIVNPAKDVTTYDVILTECKVNRLEIIKAISANSSMSQLEALHMIVNTPVKIATYDSYCYAQTLQTALEKCEAKVEIVTRKLLPSSSSNRAKK